MVHDHQGDVLLRGQPQQGDAQERPAGQVEGTPRLLGRQPPRLRLPITFRQTAQVDDRQVQRQIGGDSLGRLSPFGGEGRPQNLVPADDLLQALFQRRSASSSAGQANGGRNVVGRAAGLPLVEEPEALLGEGERLPLLGRGRPDRLVGRRLPGGAGGVDSGGQLGRSGGFEEDRAPENRTKKGLVNGK